MKVLAENQKQRAHKLAKMKTDAEELAAKMEGLSLTIGAKASANGKIFGSVNNIQIAEALEKAGFAVDRKVIYIPESVMTQPNVKKKIYATFMTTDIYWNKCLSIFM